jgi:DNA-binding winged helix-turn-helix (wHTH) protein
LSSSEPHSKERTRGQCSFGDFTLDLEHRTLRRGGEEIPLRPKSFEVLAFLVEHHGQLVTRADLMEAVWPAIAVTDNSLTQCMVEIRRALNDESQQLIRTFARRGYLFGAAVTTPVLKFPLQSAGAEALPGPGPVTPPVSTSSHRRRLSGVAALLATAAGAGLLASFTWWMWRAPQNSEPFQAIPLNSLPGVQRYPSFSPDGNQVAFTWTGPNQDNQDVYIQQIGSSGPPLRLTNDPRIDYNPVWSPDGHWIAFLRRQSEAGKSELRLIPPLGGPEQKLVDIRVKRPTSSFRRTSPGVRIAVAWLLRIRRARASPPLCSWFRASPARKSH